MGRVFNAVSALAAARAEVSPASVNRVVGESVARGLTPAQMLAPGVAAELVADAREGGG